MQRMYRFLTFGKIAEHLLLSAQDLTGEFIGEMGRAREAFQERLGTLRRQKAEYETSANLDK